MSTIDEIREQSKAVWAVTPLSATKKKASTEDEFSALLEQMKTGAPAGTGSRDSSDTQTRTVTEVLSDGSVLITVNGERRYPESQKGDTGRGGTLPAPKLMGK